MLRRLLTQRAMSAGITAVEATVSIPDRPAGFDPPCSAHGLVLVKRLRLEERIDASHRMGHARRSRSIEAWVSSATPLASLAAVVIDTETTSLDPRTARLIEIAAVRVANGRIEEGSEFERLVNPGMPVPPASTGIHGLTDDDLAGAQPFAVVKPELDRWIGRRPVVGYAVGYDLAVIRSEHERAGLLWRPPRSLDLRHLVRLLRLELPDHSLETLAGWLGIEVGRRHRALADARLAGAIYLALIPRLRERGVRTLAEAEAACRAMAPDSGPETTAGWHDVTRPAIAACEPPAALALVDSYPYRHRVRAAMSPPLFVAGEARLREVLRLIIEKRVSSVFVHPRPGEAGPGIITERDLLRAIDADPTALDRAAGAIAVRPLDTVAADDFLYRALGRMSRRGYRHLGVTDASGTIVGALSARRLLRQRAEDALWLGDTIEEAASAEELIRAWAELAGAVRSLAVEGVDPRDIAAVISHELRALTARAAALAQAELEAAGSRPPVDYALMVLGSGGRGESLLAMDQDNAIVFAAGEPGGPEDAWFERLAARLTEILDAAGVPYCRGGVMASRPEWRLSLAGWQAQVRRWIGRNRPQDLLSVDIFFDAVPVHGVTGLADALLADALAVAGGAKGFLKLLAVNAASFDDALGWFGRFRLDGGRVDVKRSGLLPLFSAARVVALAHQVSARSTPERLQAVRDKGGADAVVVDRLIEAHRILLGTILGQQLRDLEAGVQPSGRVAPAELAAAERDHVRWALEQVRLVPNLLGDPVAVA